LSVTRKGSAILLVAGVLACAGAALSASAPKWRILWAQGPTGSDFRLTAVADDGSAAGTLTGADKAHHAIFFNGKKFKAIGGKIGPGSIVRGMNNRHQIVGLRSVRPNATIADLLNVALKDSDKPHAFLYAGKVRTLSQPSYANAVNDAGVVVGNFQPPDHSIHGFAWMTGGLRWAKVRKNRFIDLGVGRANAISNPSTGWTVQIGGAVGAAGGYYTLNLLTGKFRSKALNFTGEITTVNAAGRGGGYRLSANFANKLPVLVNLHANRMTSLKLTKPFTNGVVNVVTDAGEAFGDLSGDAGPAAARWVHGTPVNVKSSLTKAQLKSAMPTTAADSGTSGAVVGGGDVKDGAWAYVAHPLPSYELGQLLRWVAQTSPKVFAGGTRGRLAKASKGSKGNSTAGCKYIDRAVHANYSDLRKPGFYLRNNLVDALAEIKSELQCPGKIVPARGLPFHH
jgi:hypothetical protein